MRYFRKYPWVGCKPQPDFGPLKFNKNFLFFWIGNEGIGNEGIGNEGIGNKRWEISGFGKDVF